MKICPFCNGAKVIAGIGCGKDGCRVMEVACFDCKGTGQMTEEQLERVAEGRRRQRDRMSRDMTLREEAKRLGISARELSDIEHGRS
jgi:hypothetical protein